MSYGDKCWKSCPEWIPNDEQIVTVNNPVCPYNFVYPACKIWRLTKEEANAEALNRARFAAYKYTNNPQTYECITVPSCTIYHWRSTAEADVCALEYAKQLAESSC